MYPSCGNGCWLLCKGREGWLRNSELFGIKGICSWLLKLPSNTASRLQDIVPTVVEASCTLNFLSSRLWGSSLGCFFGVAPGCLAWCFSSVVTTPQVTTNKGNMPVSFQINQTFHLMETKYNDLFRVCKFYWWVESLWLLLYKFWSHLGIFGVEYHNEKSHFRLSNT